MKKSSLIITGVVCGSLLLLGCTNPSEPATVSRSLENNLNNLSTAVKRLDTIDNSYLSNPDIYPLTSSITTPAPNSNSKMMARVSYNNLNLLIPVETKKQKIAKINLNLENEIKNDESVNSKKNDTSKNEASNKVNEDSIKIENVDKNKIKNTSNVKTTNTTNISNENKETTNDLANQSNTANKKTLQNTTTNNTKSNTNSSNQTTNKNYLSNYISKVQNLYDITNDTINANTELGNYKNNILLYCVEIKDLNSAVKDGTFVPTNQQIAALNNYIDDIKITIKRIKNCNGDLSDEVNSISKNDVGGITAGIDVINSNYLSVLNHLETRITYLKNAINTLEQIKSILIEAQEIANNNSSDNATDEIVEENNNNNTNNTNTETTNETIDKESGNTISNSNNAETTKNNKNIDTYLNKNGNLDSYKNTNLNNNTAKNNNTSTVNNNNNTQNKTNTTTSTVKDTSNLNSNTNVNNNLNNNNLNNNNNLINNTNKNINAPTGTFQNGIITQNNLNNGVNNGVNGKNSGYSGSNNYPYINGDINKTNKNVDTYGYNTMIDMINRGTVNNGINTLKVTEETNAKPSMVSTEPNETLIEKEEDKEQDKNKKINEESVNNIENKEMQDNKKETTNNKNNSSNNEIKNQDEKQQLDETKKVDNVINNENNNNNKTDAIKDNKTKINNNKTENNVNKGTKNSLKKMND